MLLPTRLLVKNDHTAIHVYRNWKIKYMDGRWWEPSGKWEFTDKYVVMD